MAESAFMTVVYVLATVFLVGFVARTIRLARLPMHLRWELSPIPHEKGRGRYGGSYLEELDWWTKPREKSRLAEWKYMMLEIVFLKAVWERNRGLWWFSFPFHFGLYLCIGAVGLLVLAVVGGLVGIAAVAAPGVRVACTVMVTAGYVLGAAGALGLLAKRLLDPRLRDFTPPISLFNLVLLLAVLVSGAAVVSTGRYYGEMTTFLAAAFTGAAPAALSTALAFHVGATLLFLAYLPFSTMMHFVAKYFTYHEVRWNDEPMMPGSRMEREVKELLAQPVTWGAPHVHADGTKTWVDIATEGVER